MTAEAREPVDPRIRAIVDAAREVWVRRLIDPSRANSLLFYRDLKVGTLDLTERKKAVDDLCQGRRVEIDDLLLPLSAAAQQDPVARERETAAERERIKRALIAMQRKALGNLEEKGIATLFVTYGMATWPATDGGRPYDAPVLLVPAAIEAKGRGGDDLRIALAGEPQVNPVLLFILEELFKIRIPADSLLSEVKGGDADDGAPFDAQGAFASLELQASSIRSFEIKRRVVLGNFQFAKMAMVEDLRRNADAIASNPVVAAIAGHEGSRRSLAEAVIDIEPKALDERPAQSDFLVLDADSTQHRAIVLASNGQNGVVQGPPGTGKSQTIANLIAQAVAEGKRVLFVAEKRAALDAVTKRLRHPDVGLGHLLLDLHDAAVSRKEVMAALADTMEAIRHSTPVPDAEALHREFEARRRELNAHARQVNVVRAPVALSINQILGRLLRLPPEAKSAVRLRRGTLKTLDPARFDEIHRSLLEASAASTLFLGTDSSPWNDADIRDGKSAQLLLDLVSRTSAELWPQFEDAIDRTSADLGIEVPPTLDQVSALAALLENVSRLTDIYGPSLFEKDPNALASALAPGERGGLSRAWTWLTNGDYRAALGTVGRLRKSKVGSAQLLNEIRLASETTGRWNALRPGRATPWIPPSKAGLTAAVQELRSALQPIDSILGGTLLGKEPPLVDLKERVRRLAADQRTPYQLVRIHEQREQLKAAGLRPLLDDLRASNLAPEHWLPRLEHVWLASALDAALADEPSLASFNGKAHEALVEEFMRLDRERLRLAAGRVRRLAAERAVAAMDQHFGQADLLRKEANKKTRHIPLRELLSRTTDVLMRVAPCWLASPLSVSQLLDGNKRHFDLVIFDEASQVLQEEAIPSLYRAGQVVVAGDRHQLPPTTFFATAIEGEDEIFAEEEGAREAAATASGAIGGFESLLDTMDAFLPNWMLQWHYRSEDERLIAFSNEHIYNRHLVTFPSARQEPAINHVLVPHDPSLGTQEESASREVDQIVRLIIEHAEQRAGESLGVIAMGIKHANRVQAALDAALELRSDLADFFSLEREDRFFIKNLETVQGDERDAIILTVGYGKAANGDLPHRFGPLTHETGHRRLNVAVTRARRRMTVVSSFSHHEVDLERSGSRGVQLLKAYLEYAASGGSRLPQDETAGEVGLNAFEADVKDALEARAIKTRGQFGASRYRIDLVAMHPRAAGRPVLAIECDGASYHSGATARDRDRLRQEHLMRLGWRFHRIWSTDWFYNREQEIERLVAAFEEAVRKADLPSSYPSRPQRPAAPTPPREASSSAHPARGPRPLVPVRESIEIYSDGELRQLTEWVCSDGLLRTEEEIIREVFELLPFQRMGNRIRARLERVVRQVRAREGR